MQRRCLFIQKYLNCPKIPVVYMRIGNSIETHIWQHFFTSFCSYIFTATPTYVVCGALQSTTNLLFNCWTTIYHRMDRLHWHLPLYILTCIFIRVTEELVPLVVVVQNTYVCVHMWKEPLMVLKARMSEL